ncbi:HAMP domain-containing protein [Scytonema sp. UIC 10036]|uniref:methyl-accepting chemotaxis protein n=1 Tax=Scytonema sp. UIC 10036 TaxID=2304196 RepID=UPI0012DADD16|nr:methyl-accepting chemotaxis protein [Scytonema sp. UIC 10036]MUG94751.1 HAMP domain-containing protein [Scytonema sp. UIC 10036]
MTTQKNPVSFGKSHKGFISPQAASPQTADDIVTPRGSTLHLSPDIEPESNFDSSQKRNLFFIQWFCNLSVGRKQLIALIAAELVSIVGLSVGARLIIISGLRTQMLERAKSEVTVTETNINLKVNQTGLGFRSYADNPIILNAAKVYAKSYTLSPNLKQSVKQILQNEIKARKMEYVTLVGRDFRVIVNENGKREGKIFNPNNLVREVFTNGKQIKANAVVSSAVLAKGSPVVSDPNGDTLMRYTLTPIRSPGATKVLAVLVSGEIVNGKLPIMAGILKDFNGGYSGIYLRKPTGEFTLATSLDQGGSAELKQAKPHVPLSDKSLLAAAAAAPPGEIVTGRMAIGTQSYTMTAKAIPNLIVQDRSEPVPVFSGQPVTILVRGTPETTLNKLLHLSLWQEGVVLLLAIAMTSLWVFILRKTITKPIEQLERVNQEFAFGNREARAEVFSLDEVGQLAVTFNIMADSIVVSETALAEQARLQEAEANQARLLHTITSRIRESLKKNDIFNTTVSEVRAALQADRVVVYLFNENWQASIFAESVSSDRFVNRQANMSFVQDYVKKYQKGRLSIVENNSAEDTGDLVAPIFSENKLLGLLVAYQSFGLRAWEKSKINLFKQVAIQVGFALDQATLLEQREQAQQAAEIISQEQRQQKEAIQRQVVELLNDVAEVSKGNLTIRAEVTSGEIGTVAEFFNTIIESLREIVTNVKKAALQVNLSVGENEGAIRQLADEAFKQAGEIHYTLNSVEQMALSIRSVAESARQAAVVARSASTSAEAGEIAMDCTVQSILNLQETVVATAKQMKSLGESSRQISKVVSLINQITLQTNVLAINASIEAARAGEEGKGFAVVAEEVVQLAAESGAATREIEHIVDNIQREIASVVKAMELGTTQVVEGAHLVKDTKQNLGQILNVSRQIDNLVESISLATVSQAQTSQAVTQLMKEIANVSERTCDSSRRVSASLQQTIEVAQQLQASVGLFNVGATD